ncbi:RIP metalloprotease RseP [Bacterioplanes sanyensis]|uniref:Zinc metalloprotease n=1 Tax=Bacterioplanes sanyensis TaxID=1249553 RepID=A0A222FKI2_9GAMM|nr:sigma E protease regulator RseP [Bacterioplanes sanyensis]ASP39259.1 RIP metalloprotease RseP [Bacterioplanes sanyensis]
MTVLYFIVAISLLVVIHEYGHFWVARRCGVDVLRFSVGFGKPLWSWKDKHGTEYAIAPIPLGGYVKMLDEREATVPEHLLDRAFNRKPVWQRIAIAAAGPLANFIFAIFAYWALFVGGTTGVVPVIGQVQPDSIAAQSGLQPGDEIVQIASTETETWQEVQWTLLSYLGESTDLIIAVRSESGALRQHTLPLNNWLSASDSPEPLSGLGIVPRRLNVPAVVGQLVDGGAAQAAGLQVGDLVTAVNDEPIADWMAWVNVVRNSPDQALMLTVQRGGETVSVHMTPAAREQDGQRIGFAGVQVDIPELPQDWIRSSSYDPFSALLHGLEKTWNLVGFTLESLWKMLAGDLSVKNLSGPITIAKVAGSSASGGLETFVDFLALLSVSLGVLNLLPVPMLDGGHILFYTIEALRGKPLSERVQIAALQFGMFLLLSLMMVAFYNDISRLM